MTSASHPLKVLVVSSFMPPHLGGLELVVENLVNGLMGRGHEVRWMAAAAPLPAGRDGPRIRVAAWTGLERRWNVPLPFWGPRGVRELIEHVRWADVVNIHDVLYPSSWLTTLIAAVGVKPLVLLQHIEQVRYEREILNLAQRYAYRSVGRLLMKRADEVMMYSPHVRDYFVEKVGCDRHYHLVPLGFPARFCPPSTEERAAARLALGLSEGQRVALFAGRLVPKKGVRVLADHLAALQDGDVTLLVAGNGSLAPLLAGSSAVRMLGYVPYERMHELYGAADVLLLPSVGEGLPLSLQESLLTGLSAVVSDDPSFVANVSDMPGVTIVGQRQDYGAAVVRAFEEGMPRAKVASVARSRWVENRFLDEAEEILRAAAQQRPVGPLRAAV